MRRTFNLPDLGSGLQEAELVAWRVAVGDTVTTDDVLCEVETEKSVIEIPVPFAGTVLELAVEPGALVKVGEPLVAIGGAADDHLADRLPGGDEPPVLAPAPTSASASPAQKPDAADPSVAARPLATPLVRRLAQELGLDLRTVAGTGVGGRVLRRDIEAARGNGPGAPEVEDPPRSSHRMPLTRLRSTIAAHLTAQWQTVPHVTAHTDADATRLLGARTALGERLQRKVPLDVLFVAASIAALRRFPEMNATVENDELVVHSFYDIGLAVAARDGLVVPVIRNAERSSLAALCEAVDDLTTRARDRRLAPAEQGGQTFTISNLGSVGEGHATQIVPAGTTAIVSFGRAVERPVARAGSVVVAPVLAVSATFDHRAVDGAPALRFVHALVEAIEEPALLLV